LGIHHQLWWWLFPPTDPDGPFVTACARSGSATAFALTILLVGVCVSRWYGWLGGLIASIALAIVPRLYGHAHLAALETVTNLATTATVLSIAAAWPGSHPPSHRTALWTGVIFGLALLTKIQAILIPLPLVLWAGWCWRWGGVRPVVIWGATGLAVFIAGWPWLWFDPAHFLGYFIHSGHRAELSVWWLGAQATDRTVSRLYALTYFLATTPIKLLFVGSLGCCPRLGTVKGEQSLLPPAWGPREVWILGAAAAPLVVFSLPGVPVYDGERLFLPVFPLWLVIVGRGCQLLYWRVQTLWPQGARLKQLLMLSLALIHLWPIWKLAPCQLTYYASSIGGLPTAETMGLELDYWGSSLTRSLLQDVVQHVPEGSVVAISPVVHTFQVDELLRQSPIMRQHRLRLVPYDPSKYPADFVLAFRRLADLPPELRLRMATEEPLAAVRRQRVLLAGLYPAPR
jgi:4-amino-4-deoxy-L-arabinose transferase-like glycosyltransferase